MFIRVVVSLFVLSSILFSNEIVLNKIENIIGKDDYQLHQNLIKILYKDENRYIINGKLKYYNIFYQLKQNGLLKLKFNTPKDITISFKSINSSKNGYKILNDTLHSLGYRYYLTKRLDIFEENSFLWDIKFKTEYMLDPLFLLKELQQKNCKITNVENQASNHWYYEIDFKDAILSEATKIEKNEKVSFKKPLGEYFLMVDDPKQLQVISRKLNNWFPYISFFDKELNLLKTIKKDRIYKGYKTKVPNGTKYIKITDLYNLINIKRGLSVIVK